MGWLAAASNLIGTGISAISTADQNKKSRRWSRSQWGREQTESWKKWVAENNYNHPREQMKRFKEAGLNPNLIYGQSNQGGSVGGQSGADTPQFNSPDMSGISSAVDSFYDTDVKKATADNLREQKEVIKTQKNLNLAQIEKTLTETADTQFNLGFKEEMREINAQYRQEELRGLVTSTTGKKLQQKLSIIKNSRDAREAVSKLLTAEIGRRNAEQTLKHKTVQTQIDTFKKNMWKRGVNPNDPAWQRQLLQLVEKIIKIEGTNLPNPMQGTNRNFRSNTGRGDGKTHSKYGRR